MSEIKKIKFDNGDEYEGEVKDGKPHGKGKLNAYDGEVFYFTYEGEWEDGQFSGQGKLEGWFDYSDITYVGQFKNDKMHGQGSKKYTNGEEEIGEFKEGKLFKGKVILIYSGLDNNRETQIEWDVQEEILWDGKEYEKYDEKEPIITNTLGNNEKLYIGEMMNGKRHGTGKLKQYIYEEEEAQSFIYSSYDGEWKEDKKDGFGIETIFFHEEYQGYWKEDKYHGQGELTEWWDGKDYGSGGKEVASFEVGTWENGKLIKVNTK